MTSRRESGSSSTATEVPAPPVLVAALGTQMLRLTGRMADGTITWMTGPKTLKELTGPALRAAASEAGRPDGSVKVAAARHVLAVQRHRLKRCLRYHHHHPGKCRGVRRAARRAAAHPSGRHGRDQP